MLGVLFQRVGSLGLIAMGRWRGRTKEKKNPFLTVNVASSEGWTLMPPKAAEGYPPCAAFGRARLACKMKHKYQDVAIATLGKRV